MAEPIDRVVAGMDDQQVLARIADLERKVDWLYRNAGYAPQHPNATGAVLAADAASPAVTDLLQRGQKIAAIKQYREETGVGLKEAKDFVERVD